MSFDTKERQQVEQLIDQNRLSEFDTVLTADDGATEDVGDDIQALTDRYESLHLILDGGDYALSTGFTVPEGHEFLLDCQNGARITLSDDYNVGDWISSDANNPAGHVALRNVTLVVPANVDVSSSIYCQRLTVDGWGINGDVGSTNDSAFAFGIVESESLPAEFATADSGSGDPTRFYPSSVGLDAEIQRLHFPDGSSGAEPQTGVYVGARHEGTARISNSYLAEFGDNHIYGSNGAGMVSVDNVTSVDTTSAGGQIRLGSIYSSLRNSIILKSSGSFAFRTTSGGSLTGGSGESLGGATVENCFIRVEDTGSTCIQIGEGAVGGVVRDSYLVNNGGGYGIRYKEYTESEPQAASIVENVRIEHDGGNPALSFERPECVARDVTADSTQKHFNTALSGERCKFIRCRALGTGDKFTNGTEDEAYYENCEPETPDFPPTVAHIKGRNLILTSPDGSKFEVGVDNAGNFTGPSAL